MSGPSHDDPIWPACCRACQDGASERLVDPCSTGRAVTARSVNSHHQPRDGDALCPSPPSWECTAGVCVRSSQSIAWSGAGVQSWEGGGECQGKRHARLAPPPSTLLRPDILAQRRPASSAAGLCPAVQAGETEFGASTTKKISLLSIPEQKEVWRHQPNPVLGRCLALDFAEPATVAPSQDTRACVKGQHPLTQTHPHMRTWLAGRRRWAWCE